MKWDSVCLSKLSGGLGVRELQNFNFALLCKWLWRWVRGERCLWMDIVKSRYISLVCGPVRREISSKWSLW